MATAREKLMNAMRDNGEGVHDILAIHIETLSPGDEKVVEGMSDHEMRTLLDWDDSRVQDLVYPYLRALVLTKGLRMYTLMNAFDGSQWEVDSLRFNTKG